MAEVVLGLEAVTKHYGTKVITQALRGVNLAIREAEFVALIGPSGSGKSTLLNIIGLLDRPTTGRVMIAGEDASRLDDDGLTRLRGRALGFVFQFHHLIPSLTAAENVMVPMWADHGRAEPWMRARALELLRAVGLEAKANTKSTDMSGGQQQRVAIARALSMNAPLVLADEPTGNLDTKTADEVFELLRRQNAERGTTFLIVTHDPRLAERADRVVELVDGVICSDRIL